MSILDPITELHAAFSEADAPPTAWHDGLARLAAAEIYWLTTVRPDNRPHVTPLIGIWREDAMYFCTGPAERKARNLESNRNCIITTGCNDLGHGLDVVVEGTAEQISDEPFLQKLADDYATKYEGWNFSVRDGAFYGEGDRAAVFRVAPETVFGFSKGQPFSQTRWRFEHRFTAR